MKDSTALGNTKLACNQMVATQFVSAIQALEYAGANLRAFGIALIRIGHCTPQQTIGAIFADKNNQGDKGFPETRHNPIIVARKYANSLNHIRVIFTDIPEISFEFQKSLFGVNAYENVFKIPESGSICSLRLQLQR